MLIGADLDDRTLDPVVVVGPVGIELGPAEFAKKLGSPSCLSIFFDKTGVGFDFEIAVLPAPCIVRHLVQRCHSNCIHICFCLRGSGTLILLIIQGPVAKQWRREGERMPSCQCIFYLASSTN